MSTTGHDPRPSRNSISHSRPHHPPEPTSFDRDRVRSSKRILPPPFFLLLSPSPLSFSFFFSTPISRGAIRSIFPSGRGAGRHRRSRSSSTHIRPGVAQGCVHRPPSARLGWAGVQQPGSRMWRRWMNRAAVCRVERARSALATQTSFLHSGGKVVGVRTIRKG